MSVILILWIGTKNWWFVFPVFKTKSANNSLTSLINRFHFILFMNLTWISTNMYGNYAQKASYSTFTRRTVHLPIWCLPIHPHVTCQATLSMSFYRQRYWSGVPFSIPGDLPDPGIEFTALVSPALAGRFFTAVPSGKMDLRKRNTT